MAYLPRIADGLLQADLAAAGAVQILGPKACGKTATASRLAASTIRLDIPGPDLDLARDFPATLLERPAPLLLDEWQVVPTLWDVVRRAVDDRQLKGQFVLTGSATPNEQARQHTGAGRIAQLRMRPMSLFESGASSGQVSLASLFDLDPQAHATDFRPVQGADVPLSDVLRWMVVGGWPSLVGASETDASRWLRGTYLANLVEKDVHSLTGERRDPVKLRRLIESLARNISTTVDISKLANDAIPGAHLARDTASRYLDVLARLCLYEEVPMWRPHMRSRTALAKTPARFLVDPSLAVAALGGSVERLTRDTETAGFMFEALVARDLRTYLQPLDGEISRWRESAGKQREIDFVLTLPDGRWGAIEVKLGRSRIGEGVAALWSFVENGVDVAKVGHPSFLALVVPSGHALAQKEDGTLIVPVNLLGP
jgi:predicted AAA+ superfamily ATPase